MTKFPERLKELRAERKLSQEQLGAVIGVSKYAVHLYEKGKTCPTEILETLAKYNAEGRPIWKPMHKQPMYRLHAFVTRAANGRGRTNAYIAGEGVDVGADIFARGLCLPSDNKMTAEEQAKIIEIVKACFD